MQDGWPGCASIPIGSASDIGKNRTANKHPTRPEPGASLGLGFWHWIVAIGCQHLVGRARAVGEREPSRGIGAPPNDPSITGSHSVCFLHDRVRTEEHILTPNGHSEIEMLNVLFGFVQANKYKISELPLLLRPASWTNDTCIATEDGKLLGHITEASGSFFPVFFRQIFRTSRPYRAIVTNHEGTPVLWVSPFCSEDVQWS